jgi:DNA-binding CsgD family transcriptional regulator
MKQSRPGRKQDRGLRGGLLTLEGRELFVVSVPSLTLSLPEGLTEAERSVAALVLEGRSNREVAALRGTSVRTVANQLGGIFRKLGVTGRVELGQRLASPPGRSRHR